MPLSSSGCFFLAKNRCSSAYRSGSAETVCASYRYFPPLCPHKSVDFNIFHSRRHVNTILGKAGIFFTSFPLQNGISFPGSGSGVSFMKKSIFYLIHHTYSRSCMIHIIIQAGGSNRRKLFLTECALRRKPRRAHSDLQHISKDICLPSKPFLTAPPETAEHSRSVSSALPQSGRL